MKKNQENLSDIRQILDNLVSISFAQENLISNLKTNTQNAFFSGDVLRSQNSIVNDFSLVRDSIYALAKREPELGHSVYDKINTIHSYFTKTINSINQSRRVDVMNYQQILLTNFNDLSLLFDEIANQMQNQQSQSNGSESESEQNTSKNKKEMQKRQQNTQQMQTQQQSLKNALQKMLDRIQNGDKLSSQQLAESLKMQAMMLKKLQEMKSEKGLSSSEQKLINELNRMMEENKKDIINRNINKELINRQNSIFNKMLDLENAEKSQEFDENRQSNTGIDTQNNSNKTLDIKFKEYNTKEFISTPPVDLNLFYKNKYNDYIQNLE
jgi:VanZ family protein